jgi:hypothetical protein
MLEDKDKKIKALELELNMTKPRTNRTKRCKRTTSGLGRK